MSFLACGAGAIPRLFEVLRYFLCSDLTLSQDVCLPDAELGSSDGNSFPLPTLSCRTQLERRRVCNWSPSGSVLPAASDAELVSVVYRFSRWPLVAGSTS